MAIRELLQMGNPKIYQPCAPILEFDTPELHELIHDLLDTQKAHQGVGIAAPQIGAQVQVMIYGFEGTNNRYPDRMPIDITVCINPTYEILDDTLEEGGEGCLCLLPLYGLVPRYRKVKLTYFDVTGKSHVVTAENFHARIIQHECDHLEGKIYPMRISDLTKFGFREEIIKLIA